VRIKLSRLAELLDVELEGDGECEIVGLGALASAVPGQLSFLSNPAYAGQLAGTRASAVIIGEKFRASCPASKLISLDPYVTFARATALFHVEAGPPAGIHPAAAVHEEVRLGKDVSIGANSVIEAGRPLARVRRSALAASLARAARLARAASCGGRWCCIPACASAAMCRSTPTA